MVWYHRFIHSKNRQGLSYSLAVNHLADKTDLEMKTMRGYYYTPGDHGGLAFNKSQYSLKDLPSQVDWRLYGKNNAVMNLNMLYIVNVSSLIKHTQRKLGVAWSAWNGAFVFFLPCIFITIICVGKRTEMKDTLSLSNKSYLKNWFGTWQTGELVAS